MKKRTVLLIDDDNFFLNEVINYYNSEIKNNTDLAFQFFNSVSSFSENVELVISADVVVCDLRLTSNTGISFLQYVRTINTEAKLILITGQLITESEQVICKQIGADFLFKGNGIENLMANIVYFSQEKNVNERVSHVFISYRSDDYNIVIKIVESLEKAGISAWIDRNDLLPGQDWQIAIKDAIQEGMFFLACFSSNYWEKVKNYMNEELQIAIDELRKMPDDQIWFIPIKLDDCKIPHFDIRQNKTLESKQFVRLYQDWDLGIKKIVEVIKGSKR